MSRFRYLALALAGVGLVGLVPAATSSAASSSFQIAWAAGTRCSGGDNYTVSGTGGTRSVNFSASIGCNWNMTGTGIYVQVRNPREIDPRGTWIPPYRSVASENNPGLSSTSLSGSYATTPDQVLEFRTRYEAGAATGSGIPVFHEAWVPAGCVPQGGILGTTGILGTVAYCYTTTVVAT